jgi:transposase-like protein
MKRRKWDDKLKAKVVLEGLKGRSVAEICNEYQIGQTLYYRWRDQFLANAERAFAAGKSDSHAERLLAENRRLKGVIGDLTLELKKNDW